MLKKVLVAGVICTLAYSFWFLLIGLSNPTLDSFAFRQSQTALSAYWILQGGPWLIYETPVLGSPWAIPFEFPTYQLLVALVTHTGIPMEVSGRLISYFFYVGTLVPAYYFWRQLDNKIEGFLVFSILYLACPLYLFWGRSVMIETAAVFFSMCWLALLVSLVHKPNAWKLLVCVAFGLLGALTKSTTFMVFASAGALFAGLYFLQIMRSQGLKSIGYAVAITAVAGVVPVATGYFWALFSDVVKGQNQFAAALTAKNLHYWYFGTLAQRLSSTFWIDVVWKRMLTDIFGYGAVFAVAAFGVNIIHRKSLVTAGLAVVIFLSSLLTFTNLHFVHSYYQVANAICLIFAVAVSISCIITLNRPVLATALVGLILTGQVAYTLAFYLPMVRSDPVGEEYYSVGLVTREQTKPGDAIIVIGTDWSSEIPYYAQRKGLAVRAVMPDAELVASIQNPRSILGDTPLGAIVDCRTFTGTQNLFPAVNNLLATMRVKSDDGKCRVYQP